MFYGYIDDVIRRTNEPILRLKVLVDLRLQYESLESFTDFLVFLVPKLCQKVPNISGMC